MNSIQTRFTYQGLPHRIVFGRGRRASIKSEMDALGCHTPLLLCTPEQRETALELATIAGFDAAIFSEATMHTPVLVTERALEYLIATKADCLIAVGGGSAIGLAKALALRTDLPQIAIPTTYAGSEVTPIVGETKDSEKRTQRTLKVLPEVVIYDAELTLSLPIPFTVTSGINAIAHAVEALYAIDGNPIISMMAEDGIGMLVTALLNLIDEPLNIEAREQAQYGAWLCGTCLGSVGMALHHKVCHVLGGSFDLPHAPTHTVILPHALAYTAPAIPNAIETLSRIFGTTSPWSSLYKLNIDLGAPTSLAELGMQEHDLDLAVELVLQHAYANPRPPERASLRNMLQKAFTGDQPAID